MSSSYYIERKINDIHFGISVAFLILFYFTKSENCKNAPKELDW